MELNPGIHIVMHSVLSLKTGCDNIANFEARMQAMTKPTYTAITQHAKSGKPALVFVPTRKHARLTALDLCAYSSAEGGGTLFFLDRKMRWILSQAVLEKRRSETHSNVVLATCMRALVNLIRNS
jgi:replicative superfamily II helicase